MKLIIICVGFLLLLSLIECKKNDKRRLKENSGTFIDSNVCNNLDRDSKVHCYCEVPFVSSAKTAECWVFNGGIDSNDNLWSNFKSQTYLEKLSFNVRADGALTFVPSNVIKHMSQLQYLRIQYASIETLNKYAFANCSTLREIVLVKDNIITLEKYSVSHLKSLHNITIAQNKITEIATNVFIDLPNIRDLILSNNNITIIHEGSFEHLNSLVELQLDGNSISVLTRDTFRGLSNLRRLDIRSNKINMIGDLTFSELWNLQDLLLDNNNVMYVAERAFDGLSLLRRLTMTGNKLQNIDEGLLEGVRSLMFLDLRNNQLETLTYETIKPIVDNLKTPFSVLFLDGNQLFCDCRLAWIHVLRDETKSEQLQTTLRKVSCLADTALTSRLGLVEVESTTNQPTCCNDYSDDSEGFVYDVEGENDLIANRVRKNLINIPVELLPCPQNLIYPSGSYGPPSQDEVKYYGNAFSSGLRISIGFIQILSATLILVR